MEPSDPNVRIIHSLEDLELHKDDFDRRIKQSKEDIVSRLDSPIDLEQWRKGKGETLARAFHKEEEIIREAIENFERTIATSEVSSSLPVDEQEKLKAHLQELQKVVKGTKEETKRTLLEGKAKLLTKYFWGEVDFLKKISLPTGELDREKLIEIKEEFSAQNLEGIVTLYREVMDRLQGDADPLFQKKTIEGTLHQGYLYDLREELLLAFTEMKLHVKNTLPVVYSELARLRAEEKEAAEETLSTFFSSALPLADKSLEKIFTKKIVSKPKEIAQLSLFLASRQHAMGAKGGAAAGGGIGVLTGGFSLPASAFSVYKMGRLLQRSQNISQEIEEASRIQNYAKLLIKEGEALQENGLKRRSFATGKEDEEFAKREIDQGSHLLSLGYELEEKTEMATHELEKERRGLKGELFLSGGLTASQLANSASGIGQTLNAFLSSFSTTTAGVALHWVGMGGAGIGIILGGINLGLSLKELHEKQKEVDNLYLKSQQLDEVKKSFSSDPFMASFIEKESSLQLIQEKKLRVDQKNLWISIANNTFLVIAGAVGIGVLVATGVASFGLTLAVIGILVLVTVIATSHFFLKRKWEKELALERAEIVDWDQWIKELAKQIKTFKKEDPRFKAIAQLFEISKEKETSFHLSPEIFLQTHYLKG